MKKVALGTVVVLLLLAVLAGCGKGKEGDTTPPVISQVAESGITTSGVTITWTTDEAATSQVEYGATTSYGSTTTPDTNLVTSHSVDLSGLAAKTTYHYRVKSKDAAQNEAISDDATFDSLPSTSSAWTPPFFTFLNETTTLNYEYDEHGVPTGASASGTVEVSDGLGSTYVGTVDITYSIIHGKAKPLRKTTYLSYDYGDISGVASALEPVPILSPVEWVTDYQHDENGVLLGGTTYVTLENIGGAGNVTAICTVSTTCCTVVFGMGKGERVKLVAHLPDTALGGYTVKYIHWECRAAQASDTAQGQVDVDRL